MNAGALLAFLSLVALAALFYGPWQSICTDIARQIIFEQRDKLFDIANDGRMEFTSREYREIRTGLEDLIRFSHDLTLARVIYLAVALPQVRHRDLESSLVVAISRVSDSKLTAELWRIVSKAYFAVVLMMLAKSAIGVVMTPFVIAAAVWAKLVKRIAQLCASYLFKMGKIIQVEAECAY
jgi:hypothetical protein